MCRLHSEGWREVGRGAGGRGGRSAEGAVSFITVSNSALITIKHNESASEDESSAGKISHT